MLPLLLQRARYTSENCPLPIFLSTTKKARLPYTLSGSLGRSSMVSGGGDRAGGKKQLSTHCHLKHTRRQMLAALVDYNHVSKASAVISEATDRCTTIQESQLNFLVCSFHGTIILNGKFQCMSTTIPAPQESKLKLFCMFLPRIL